MRHAAIVRGTALAWLALAAIGCGPGSTPAAVGEAGRSQSSATYPFVRVLGSAQDGGFPHVACNGPRCTLARRSPELARRVASLALVTGPNEVYLVDATPDLPAQLEAISDQRSQPSPGVDRDPLRGVFLTHAHLGHYTGLGHLGFEAVHTQGLGLYATPRMLDFLATNGPWSQLFTLGNVEARPLPPGGRTQLTGVTVEAFTVPHRDEFSDTVAFVLRGPSRSLLYVPDTDRWSTWDRPLRDLLAEVDVALLDGTFYSADELPGRSLEQIPHPLITTTMDLLSDIGELRAAVYFTHLNHSNPALDPASDASREITRRGFAVVSDGQQFPL